MKKFIALFLFLVILVSSLATPALTYAQAAPSVYYGAYADNLSGFESASGKAVSLEMFFHGFDQSFPTGEVESARSHGAIPIVSWDPYLENTDVTSWENLAAGKDDDYIIQWAKDAKAWGHPLFLRLNWEMNGYWQPYTKQSASFVPMWKHIHDLFVQNGATNVTWVWCPNVDGYDTMPLESLYPGNDYVDWVCMDGYNTGTTQSWSTWMSFSTIFKDTYNHLLRLAPGKPIMIGETASTEIGGPKGDWIVDFLKTQLPQNFPNVKAFVWFDTNKETDWRIESSANTTLSFAQGISSPYYSSNNYGDLSASPIPYLGSLSGRAATSYAYVSPKPTLKPTAIPPVTSTPTKTPVIVNSANNSSDGLFDKINKNVLVVTLLVGFFAIAMIREITLEKPRKAA